MLARFGRDGNVMTFGNIDLRFVGIGTLVGYAIIVPSILCTYLMGANLTFLELFINFVGGVLFIVIGALSIHEQRSHGSYHSKEAHMALACLCIVTGINFFD